MKRMTVRFPEDLWQEIGECAKALGISKSEYARRALTRHLDELDAERAEPAAAQATRHD